MRFRRRMFLGVTSTNSSSPMNSIACSSERSLGGTKRMASSALEARMLVSFFSLINFTLTRDDIINLAHQHVGAIGEGETASANQITEAAKLLNMIVKLRASDG